MRSPHSLWSGLLVGTTLQVRVPIESTAGAVGVCESGAFCRISKLGRSRGKVCFGHSDFSTASTTRHHSTLSASGRLARVIESLNSSGVEYLIVGAVALAYRGIPRYTGDHDILVHNSPENSQRLESALQSFGFAALGLKAADFVDSYRVIQLGVPPNRIDLLTSITGVSFEQAWAERIGAELEGIRANFIGRQALIQNKRSCGRPQDLADLRALGADR